MIQQMLFSFGLTSVATLYASVPVLFAFFGSGWLFGMFGYAIYSVTLGMK